jgi:transketolase
VYIRSGRPKAPLIYDAELKEFVFGKAHRLREGNDVTIIANGMLVGAALVAHERLRAEGISVRVVDMACVQPLDEEEIRLAALETGGIVAAEEHLVHGGLGARIAQVVVRLQPAPMEFVGLSGYAESGDPEALMRKYGLTADNVIAAVRRLLTRRNGKAHR